MTLMNQDRTYDSTHWEALIETIVERIGFDGVIDTLRADRTSSPTGSTTSAAWPRRDNFPIVPLRLPRYNGGVSPADKLDLIQSLCLAALAIAMIFVAWQVRLAIVASARELKSAIDQAGRLVTDLNDSLRSLRNRVDRLEDKVEGNNKRPPSDLSAKTISLR